MCEPRQAACMEKLLEATWMIPKLDLARSPRVTRARQTLLAKLIETQIDHPPSCTGWVVGEFNKRTTASENSTLSLLQLPNLFNFLKYFFLFTKLFEEIYIVLGISFTHNTYSLFHDI